VPIETNGPRDELANLLTTGAKYIGRLTKHIIVLAAALAEQAIDNASIAANSNVAKWYLNHRQGR